MNTGTNWQGKTKDTDETIIGARPCTLLQALGLEQLDIASNAVMPQRPGVNAPYQDEYEAA